MLTSDGLPAEKMPKIDVIKHMIFVTRTVGLNIRLQLRIVLQENRKEEPRNVRKDVIKI